MFKIEDIVEIRKLDDVKARYRNEIEFKDGSIIRIKRRRCVLPILLLIKYQKTSNHDYENQRHIEIEELVRGKYTYEGYFRVDYKSNEESFRYLYNSEGFDFIQFHKVGSVNYYILAPEDHWKLLLDREVTEYRLRNYEKEYVFDKQGFLCNMCGKIMSYREATIDYIIPPARGGEECAENTELLCLECFKKKRKICKNCIEICDKSTCPIYKEKEIKKVMMPQNAAMIDKD